MLHVTCNNSDPYQLLGSVELMGVGRVILYCNVSDTTIYVM